MPLVEEGLGGNEEEGKEGAVGQERQEWTKSYSGWSASALRGEVVRLGLLSASEVAKKHSRTLLKVLDMGTAGTTEAKRLKVGDVTSDSGSVLTAVGIYMSARLLAHMRFCLHA